MSRYLAVVHVDGDVTTITPLHHVWISPPDAISPAPPAIWGGAPPTVDNTLPGGVPPIASTQPVPPQPTVTPPIATPPPVVDNTLPPPDATVTPPIATPPATPDQGLPPTDPSTPGYNPPPGAATPTPQ